MDINRFFTYLSGIHPISAEFRAYVTQIIREEFYTKNQVLLSSGQVASRLWFIEKGFAMEYSNKNGEKKPYRFWDEGEILVDVTSFFRQTPSEGYIEILETSTLLAINYTQMQSLLEQFPETQILVNSIVEAYHRNVEKKALDLLTLSAEERYQQLLQTPSILQKTSIENIAAYLGISRKALGRIRARKKRK
jgi:CRP-like cAMP-binding protein